MISIPSSSLGAMKWVDGSCHCEGVYFQVALTSRVTVTLCNCRICYMSGHEEILVPETRFRLIRGSELLREYRFGTMTADHTFCSRCGVMPFYRPRSHPEGYRSVNARCLLGGGAVALRRGDKFDLSIGESVEFTQFDGQNWEQSMREGSHVITE